MTTLVTLRPAVRSDSRCIAAFYQISADGVADYIWSKLAEPGEDLLDAGARRYARTGTEFSFENCLIGERDGVPVAMMHSYRCGPPATPEEIAGIDPVIRPYAKLEIEGSLYISSLAVDANLRSQGIGHKLLQAAKARALELSCPELSLTCFAGNERALALYRREGFDIADECDIVPHPLIRHTGKALLMALQLG